MRVLVDVDNTLNDLTKPFIKEVLHLGYNFNVSKYTSWDLSKAIEGSDDPEKVVDEIFSKVSFWDSLKPVEDCQRVLKRLSKDFHIIIATIPWRNTDEFINSRLNWLQEYFSFINDVSFKIDKWNIPGEVIIDDKPDTLIKCTKKITIKPIHIYNIDTPSDFSFGSWSEVPRIFNLIQETLE